MPTQARKRKFSGTPQFKGRPPIDWPERLITLVGEGSKIKDAVQQLNVSYIKLYRKRAEDPAFAVRFDTAKNSGRLGRLTADADGSGPSALVDEHRRAQFLSDLSSGAALSATLAKWQVGQYQLIQVLRLDRGFFELFVSALQAGLRDKWERMVRGE